MQLFLKIFSGMANSVDLDQTVDLGLHCLHDGPVLFGIIFAFNAVVS